MFVCYVFPSYLCFKHIAAKSSPSALNDAKLWSVYWVVVALWTCLERLLDVSIFWLPLYCEAKVAFCLYLWHPSTRGAEFLYYGVIEPLFLANEDRFDHWIENSKDIAYTRVRDAVSRLYEYAKGSVVELLNSAQQQQVAQAGSPEAERSKSGAAGWMAKNAQEAAAFAFMSRSPSSSNKSD